MASTQRSAADGKFIKTHGCSYQSEYRIWGNMIYRCHTNTSANKGYSGYGGRGISVYPGWRESFDFFGRQLTARQIAEELGVSKETVVKRIRRGWTMDRIASTPQRRVHKCS